MNPTIVIKMNIDLLKREEPDAFNSLKKLNDGWDSWNIPEDHLEIVKDLELVNHSGRPYTIVTHVLNKYFK